MNVMRASYAADQLMIEEYESIIRMRRGPRFGQIEYQCAIQREGSDVDVSEWTDVNGAHLASLAMLASMNIKLMKEAEMLLDAADEGRVYDEVDTCDEPGFAGGVRRTVV